MMNAINSMLYPTISLKFSLHDKIKVSINKKNRSQLSNIRCLQNFYQEKKASPDYLTIKDKNSNFSKRATENSVWVAKFNLDGDFLATGGSDAILRVYEINKDIENCTVRYRTQLILILAELINTNCSIYKFHQSDIVDLTWNNVKHLKI